MAARTYTPEAIDALVQAARRAMAAPIGFQSDLEAALRPFTTEPSSWAAFCRELWGEGWWGDGVAMCDDLDPTASGEPIDGGTIDAARAAYRARYGVEP